MIKKFEVYKNYKVSNLEKFGWEAVIELYERINHKDGYSTLKFILKDLKIKEFNIGAQEFIYSWNSKWRVFNADYAKYDDQKVEFIDCYYFIIDSQNEL